MKTNWILNRDGSIYHLGLRPDQIGDFIFTVGDPERVSKVSQYLDTIECSISSREFKTHTGYLGKKRISIISTGIGTDNIDIVLHELDALWNLDFETMQYRKTPFQGQIIRLGTSGAIQKHIPVDSILLTEKCIGVDALGDFYGTEDMDDHMDWKEAFNPLGLRFYCCRPDPVLLSHFHDSDFLKGITCTAPGFYAAQGRTTRIESSKNGLLENLESLRSKRQEYISNIEMETSGIYRLGSALGHRCLSVNAILANRITGEFSKNPEASIQEMITRVLQKISE